MPKRLFVVPRVNWLCVDGHVHIYTNYRLAAKLLEPGSRELSWLVKQVISRAINCVGITNFHDRNYEFWTDMKQIDHLPDDWSFYQDSRLTVIVTNDGYIIYLFKSEEVSTPEGHVLLWGGTWSHRKRPFGINVDALLDEISKDRHFTRIADHVFSRWHGLRDHLLGRRTLFDALEWNASTDGNKRAEEYAEDYLTPLIASSDAHRPSDIGKAYTVFKGRNLSFKNGDEFMASIRDQVRGKNFEVHKERCPIFSAVHHIFYNILHINLYKLGWRSLGS